MKEFKSSLISAQPATKTISFLSLGFLSFAVPFFLGHSQLITGIVVNMALFSTVILLPANYLLPIALFPSLAVLSRGAVFGPFTPFLIYFLPAIWLGNILLMMTFKKVYPTSSYGKSIILASTVKSVFLFFFANVFFSFHLVPKLFLQTMGINQFITAIMGGVLSGFFLKQVKYESTKQRSGSTL